MDYKEGRASQGGLIPRTRTSSLGFSFVFLSEDDERDLNASLHRELSLLEPNIKSCCEALFMWGVLDVDQKEQIDTRVNTAIWLSLPGMENQFPRRHNREHFRIFELEIFVVSDEKFSFTLFEDVTENKNEAPFRYQEVAEGEVETSKLGLAILKHYRPQTGDSENME